MRVEIGLNYGGGNMGVCREGIRVVLYQNGTLVQRTTYLSIHLSIYVYIYIYIHTHL